MNKEKEVRFDIYCAKCVHRDLDENEDPCWDCLIAFTNVDSKKPVCFKEANDENSNRSSDV